MAVAVAERTRLWSELRFNGGKSQNVSQSCVEVQFELCILFCERWFSFLFQENEGAKDCTTWGATVILSCVVLTSTSDFSSDSCILRSKIWPFWCSFRWRRDGQFDSKRIVNLETLNGKSKSSNQFFSSLTMVYAQTLRWFGIWVPLDFMFVRKQREGRKTKVSIFMIVCSAGLKRQTKVPSTYFVKPSSPPTNLVLCRWIAYSSNRFESAKHKRPQVKWEKNNFILSLSSTRFTIICV